MLNLSFFFQKTISGLTGLVKFDNEGFRSDFHLHVFQLREEEITPIGSWNISHGTQIKFPDKENDVVMESSLQNTSFVVITTLVKIIFV